MGMGDFLSYLNQSTDFDNAQAVQRLRDDAKIPREELFVDPQKAVQKLLTEIDRKLSTGTFSEKLSATGYERLRQVVEHIDEIVKEKPSTRQREAQKISPVVAAVLHKISKGIDEKGGEYPQFLEAVETFRKSGKLPDLEIKDVARIAKQLLNDGAILKEKTVSGFQVLFTAALLNGKLSDLLKQLESVPSKQKENIAEGLSAMLKEVVSEARGQDTRRLVQGFMRDAYKNGQLSQILKHMTPLEITQRSRLDDHLTKMKESAQNENVPPEEIKAVDQYMRKLKRSAI